jgi:hypothetical protein
LGNEVEAVPVAKRAKKVGMSAAGRARVAAAQKARWAKVKGAKPSAFKTVVKALIAAKSVKKTHKMSAAGRAKIAAVQKARWAKIKAEKAAK